MRAHRRESVSAQNLTERSSFTYLHSTCMSRNDTLRVPTYFGVRASTFHIFFFLNKYSACLFLQLQYAGPLMLVLFLSTGKLWHFEVLKRLFLFKKKKEKKVAGFHGEYLYVVFIFHKVYNLDKRSTFLSCNKKI